MIEVSAGLMAASVGGTYSLPQQGLYAGGMYLPQHQAPQVPQSIYQTMPQPMWQPLHVMQQQATLPLQQQLGAQLFQPQQLHGPTQVMAQPPMQAQAAAQEPGVNMADIQKLISASITQAMGDMTKKVAALETSRATDRARNKDKNNGRDRNSRDRREMRERRERERADNTDEEVEQAMRELGLNGFYEQ